MTQEASADRLEAVVEVIIVMYPLLDTQEVSADRSGQKWAGRRWEISVVVLLLFCLVAK